MEFTGEESNTLILFLAYSLGHLRIVDEGEVRDLFESAEMLRQRIERSCTPHNRFEVGAVQRGRDGIAAR